MSMALLIFVATIVVSLVALYVVTALIDRLAFRPYYVQRRGQYYTVSRTGSCMPTSCT